MPAYRTARITGVLALALACLACGPGRGVPVSSIEPSELAARISAHSAPVILDVRSPDEFASGHIPGALNVPVGELPNRLAALALSPTEEIVVHCERGGRAALAESILRESGYTRVRDLSGHMEAWRAAGYSVE